MAVLREDAKVNGKLAYCEQEAAAVLGIAKHVLRDCRPAWRDRWFSCRAKSVLRKGVAFEIHNGARITQLKRPTVGETVGLVERSEGFGQQYEQPRTN